MTRWFEREEDVGDEDFNIKQLLKAADLADCDTPPPPCAFLNIT